MSSGKSRCVTTARSAPIVADIVYGHDVRMIQSSSGARFQLEAAAAFRALRHPGRQNLDGYIPAQPWIGRDLPRAWLPHRASQLFHKHPDGRPWPTLNPRQLYRRVDRWHANPMKRGRD